MQTTRISIRALVLLAVLSAVGLIGSAQQPQSQPPVMKHPHNLDSSYIQMPLAPSEQRYGALQGDHIKEFDKQIVAFSIKDRDEGNLLWGRIAGTKNDDLAEGWVESKFKAFGLQDIHRQYFDLPP